MAPRAGVVGPLEMRLTVHKSWWAAPEKRFTAQSLTPLSGGEEYLWGVLWLGE